MGGIYKYTFKRYPNVCIELKLTGLFLHTKLVSGTNFFPNWLKKIPIDLKLSHLNASIICKLSQSGKNAISSKCKEVIDRFPNFTSTKNFPNCFEYLTFIINSFNLSE